MAKISEEKLFKPDYKKVSDLMAKKGLSQAAVSVDLGYSASYYAERKRTNTEIKLHTAKHLALILGVNLDDIRYHEPEAKPEPKNKPADNLADLGIKTINSFNALAAKIDKVDSDIEVIDNRTNALATRSIKTADVVSKILSEMETLKETVGYLYSHTKNMDFNTDPVEYAKAFIKGIMGTHDETLESTIRELAKIQGIDPETLNLAKGALELRTLSRNMGKTVYRFWAKPYCK